jgi:chemotaxis protein CheD
VSVEGTVTLLHPGDVACGDAGDRLETLLGSCVAVVLTDPRRTIGAMCHIVHAGAGSGTAHAGPAIDRLYAHLLKRAIQPRFCEAYVYGGGNMFPQLVQRQAGHVGTRNIDVVLERLRRDGVRIVHQDVGGTAYRRLRWTVGPGAPEVVAVEM